MKFKIKILIILGVLAIALIIGALIWDSVNQETITFSVFEDRKDNFKNSISLKINLPLSEKEACLVAAKSCNCSCLTAGRVDRSSTKDYPFEFDWIVKCGIFTVYIDEKEKTVVCFCPYE